MDVVILRDEKPGKTPGQIFVDGRPFAFILEDQVRDHNADGDLDDAGEGKVYGQTAIPYGTYQLKVTYSNRFKKDMIQVFNIPGGKIRFGTELIDACGVRIHGGNTVENTLGCPLMGANRKPDGDVFNCKDVNDKLVALVREACKTQMVLLNIRRKV